MSNNFYQIKKNLFGDEYNLLGLDYYSGGIFLSNRLIHRSIDNSNLTKSFDWRTKHDSNLETSKYWDGYPDKYLFNGEWRIDKNGWVTRIRNQNGTYACNIFSSVASFSTVINLYYNTHLDALYKLRLSEKQVYNCSPYGDYKVGCDTLEGKSIAVIHKFFTSTNGEGVITERCYPWRPPYCNGFWTSCDLNPYILCESYDTIVFTENYEKIDLNLVEDEVVAVKKALMDKGPLTIGLDSYVLGEIQPGPHAVSLIGFDTDLETGIITWTVKNSWGPYWGDLGYFHVPFSIEDDIDNDIFMIGTTILTEPPGLFEINDVDEDKDGYYNWGIGERFQDYECSNEEDWNDNDNRIGTKDSDYIGIPVMPEMKVYIMRSVDDIVIRENSFLSFSSDDLDEDHNLKIYIENTGSAQLNLQPHGLIEGKVEIITVQGGSSNFEVEGYPARRICWGQQKRTDFLIHFSGSAIGELTKIKIYLDENGDIPDFEFILVYNDCQTDGEIIEISGYQHWDSYSLKTQDYLVSTGATLLITGDIAMGSNSDIFVAPGGKLKIDGGRLTSGCSGSWNGIDVWGNSRMPQVPEYQGMVEVKNGGMIEFADTAISTSLVHGIYTNPTGGIVNCKDAVFKDNYLGVCLYPYVSPIGNPNFSRFKRTEFKITDDYYNLDDRAQHSPKCSIQLDGVIGLFIEGCSFINESHAERLSRGIGLVDLDAGCFVTGACKVDNQIPCNKSIPSKFEGFDYGIRASNLWSSRTISVDSADFIDNYRGIYLGLVNDASIIKSNFYLNADNDYFKTVDILVGIYTERCNRYQIEENHMLGAEPGNFELVGMHILNSGTDHNEVYNNYFENIDYGIIAAGENRNRDGSAGLCIKCNDFTDCMDDIFITPDGGTNRDLFGISQKQGQDGNGDNRLAAGNTFSDVTSFNYINDQDCGHIIYKYHGQYQTEIIIPDFIGDMETDPDPFAFYSKIGSCPSHLGGGITTTLEKHILTTETNLISAYYDTLLIAIDGGNTEGLNYDIITSFPEEALVIRQELIDESPFLSDTVMISAIEKEDVLPGAMIRDVLVQNPQAPKSKRVMEALDQRQDSIPDYMMDEILQGLDCYGAKELMEQELGSHIAKRDEAWKNLNLFYKNDTLNIENSIDSLIVLHEVNSSLSTSYDLAFIHLTLSDSMNAFTVLNNIPSEFELNAQELATQSYYQELFNILWEIKEDTTGLSSLQIQLLFELADSYQTIPGLYASNLLIKERLLNYEEPVYLADPVKNSPAHNKAKLVPLINHNLWLFPNPAGNYFIAYYYLHNQLYPSILVISDINGIKLKEIYLRDNQNQIVISTQELSAGAYLVSLICRNHLIESQKVTIIK